MLMGKEAAKFFHDGLGDSQRYDSTSYLSTSPHPVIYNIPYNGALSPLHKLIAVYTKKSFKSMKAAVCCGGIYL